GMGAIGNGNDGIRIAQGTASNTIGGTQTGAGNIIAFNMQAGVVVGNSVTDTATINNTIRANSISSNSGLGIDLGNDGVTANHVGGGVAGPNNLHNFPIIVAAAPGSATAVTGTLNSVPNAAVTLDFYASAAPDSSGFGQGQRYLGSTVVTTDNTGNVRFSVSS